MPPSYFSSASTCSAFLSSSTSTDNCYFTIDTSASDRSWPDDSPCTSPIEESRQAPSPSDCALSTAMSSPVSAVNSAMPGKNGMSSSTHRPSPYVVHSERHTSGSDSDGSASSFDSIHSSPESARCSRCHRTSSIDYRTGKSNLISYGLNLWYCHRCGVMVGLIKDR